MVQSVILNDVVKAARSPRFRVRRSVNNPRNPCKDYRPRAHRARLQSDIERCSEQTPVANLLRSDLYRQHLRVCNRIPGMLPQIMCSSELRILSHNYRTDRTSPFSPACCANSRARPIQKESMSNFSAFAHKCEMCGISNVIKRLRGFEPPPF